MDQKYKKYYVLLSLLVVMFLGLYSFVNVFYYGSIVQINVPILSLILIMPLYLGFKFSKYSKRMVLYLSVCLAGVVVWTLVLIPPYTYDEALEIVGQKEELLELQVKKRTGQGNFFYAGDYYIESKTRQFSFDVLTGHFQVIEENK